MKTSDLQAIKEAMEATLAHRDALCSVIVPVLEKEKRMVLADHINEIIDGLAISATKLQVILDDDARLKNNGKKLMAELERHIKSIGKTVKTLTAGARKSPSPMLLSEIIETMAMQNALIDVKLEAMRTSEDGKNPNVAAIWDWLNETTSNGGRAWPMTREIGYHGRPIQSVLMDLDQHNGRVRARKIVRNLLIYDAHGIRT